MPVGQCKFLNRDKLNVRTRSRYAGHTLRNTLPNPLLCKKLLLESTKDRPAGVAECPQTAHPFKNGPAEEHYKLDNSSRSVKKNLQTNNIFYNQSLKSER